MRIVYQIIDIDRPDKVVAEADTEEAAIAKIEEQFKKHNSYLSNLELIIRKVWTNRKPPAEDLL